MSPACRNCPVPHDGAVTYTELTAQRPGAEADDDAFVALTHESGVRSHLWMNAVAAALGPRFRLLGDRGAYVKYGLDVQEDALRAGHRPDKPRWGEELEEQWGVLTADGETRALPTEPGSYRRFYEGVVAALRGEGPPPVDPKDGVAVAQVIDAARASAGENRVVELA